MLIGKKLYTRAEFNEFVQMPQHSGRVFELINGEIVEKMPTFGYSSGVGARLTTFIGMYLLQNDIAHFTDAQGGYDIDADNTLVPDVGIILKSRQAALPKDSYVPVAPDFAIEVVSQSDLKDPANRIDEKIKKYRAAGVPLLWYVYPDTKQVKVYRNGELVQTAGINDTLDGGDVLPGFTLAVKDIFPA